MDRRRATAARAAARPVARVPAHAALMAPASFLERLHQATGATVPSLALILIDVDGFHAVNDRHGYPAGDRFLDALALRLAGDLRAEDLVTRLGGDEFAALVLEPTGPGGAAAIARRLLASVRHAFLVDGEPYEASACAGLALCPEHGRDARGLLRAARAATRYAKQDGPDSLAVHVASDDHDDGGARIERELRIGVQRGELELHFQPMHNLRTGGIEGLEALIRWQHPELGLLAPDSFMPIAERSGLAPTIGKRVLERACAELSRWRAAGHPALRVSVNVSARDFRRTGFVGAVLDALDRHGLPPDALELELMEHELLDAGPGARQARELARRGIGLAIDDFGMKYSSLSYLHQLPVNTIKVDRAFIRGMGTSPASDSIVAAVAGIADGLGLRLVAEGVEETHQVHRLRSVGCEIMQGYLFSRPVPAAEIDQYLLRAARSA